VIAPRAKLAIPLLITMGVVGIGCCRKPPPTVADCDDQYAAVGPAPPLPASGITEDQAGEELMQWAMRCKSAEEICGDVGRAEKARELETRCADLPALSAKIHKKFAADRAK
jgi:hypothetical protein